MKLALLLFLLTILTEYSESYYAAKKIFQFTNITDRNKIKRYDNDYEQDKSKVDISITKQEKVDSESNGEVVIEFADATENLIDVNASEKSKYSYEDVDPTTHMTTPQIIALNGYPAESHTIVTDDGYILTVHRIPFSKSAKNKVSLKKTVLLHHGLLTSSIDWVITGPRKGLAYILSEAGYDVWMANARGNTYSKAHVSRKVDSFEFWNFTFHEIGQHDLPAVIDYIMEVKGLDTKINYIGHSMGTTVLFVLLSTKPQYNKILRAGFTLAPVAYMSDVKSPIRYFARFADDIEYLIKLLGANEFLPDSPIIKWLSKLVCEINNWEEVVCENFLFVICGFDAKEFNRTLFPTIFGHLPAGASTKTLIHYFQEMRHNGNFQQFDYGIKENLKRYGRSTPPKYALGNITLPIALLSARNDWLASEVDVTRLFMSLGNPIENYIIPMKDFNHVDFLWANDAPKLVYTKLISMLKKSPGITRFISFDNKR